MEEASRCLFLLPRAKADVGSIFRGLGKGFLEREQLNPDQKRVFERVSECGTAAMGGSAWHCQSCGHWVGVYHSCRDRHCPKCQASKRAAWVEDRLEELLTVPYFHVVFTLPHVLHPLIKINPKKTMGLLFRCATKTLLTFAADSQWLGAEPGILTVLHTWGRKLNYHVHVHCLVTGGGLSPDRTRWVPVPKPGFLFPEGALAKVFRGKYLEGLDELRLQGLRQPAGLVDGSDAEWDSYKRKVAGNKWVSHVQFLSGGPKRVVKYLARYINRVGISNQRILSYGNDRVRFSYQDTKDEGHTKVLELEAACFARRYLSHVLPRGFPRIRYSGFLASCKKKKSLVLCQELLMGNRIGPDQLASLINELNATTPDQGAEPETPKDEVRKCPRCLRNQLRLHHTLTRFDQKRARALLWDSS